MLFTHGCGDIILVKSGSDYLIIFYTITDMVNLDSGI